MASHSDDLEGLHWSLQQNEAMISHGVIEGNMFFGKLNDHKLLAIKYTDVLKILL